MLREHSLPETVNFTVSRCSCYDKMYAYLEKNQYHALTDIHKFGKIEDSVHGVL